jgi:signal peptidase I
MEPTFKNNQITFLIKNTNVNKNDIIVFKKDDTVYIKRVIAQSNDSVELHDGYVYINGVKYISYTYNGENITYTLHENQFFVIGDNYNNSIDSRVFGLINSDQIIGQAIN